MWEARLKALRTANAKQVVNRSLDRLDPVGIRTELDSRKGAAPGDRVLKGGHVIDFYRATVAEYPDDVVVARVGDFYEAYGLSAVMLIEHGNLNPMGGWNARAGMPIKNIQKTLDDLVAAGLSVTVCEERDPPKGKRKERFVTERIHANNPQYLYNSLAREGDGTVPRDAVPFVGVVRDSAGAMRVVVVDPVRGHAPLEATRRHHPTPFAALCAAGQPHGGHLRTMLCPRGARQLHPSQQLRTLRAGQRPCRGGARRAPPHAAAHR